MERPAPAVRPPVALGCTFAVAAVVFVVLVATLLIVFLESGANEGNVALEDARAYANGSVEYVSKSNFYLVRLQDGTFLALSDLDAPNRASAQRRCRVAPLNSADPALPGLVAKYATRMSPDAAGSSLLFREDCNLAIYDFTGTRLDADGPNLDRLAITLTDAGKLAVNVTKRTCTRREGTESAVPAKCP
jgi:hypothetical protein